MLYKQSHCIEQLFAEQGRADKAFDMTLHAHNALGDVRMCKEIYLACCERLSVQHNDFAAVYALSEESKAKRRKNRKAISEQYHNAPISIMPFGKHRGQAIDSLPKSYVRWVLANVSDLRPNLVTALFASLNSNIIE
ncbi:MULTISPECIES: putative quorum-sensing-regulated virulence factor [unclassified Acinetobacter]|uniref:putative quorum-sensing-regulated virulence factor n=1 Tax=unclassified Acinetobacter TaxID=196816 RepID=UPI0035B800E8